MNSDWQAFRLVPDDVFFFRDGKPSSRGADHYLRSLFPPHPFTLYGALRTRRLLDEGVRLAGLDRSAWGRLPHELRQELGEWGGFGTLSVRGPWLVRGENEPLVPAPADLGLALVERPRSEEEPRVRGRRGGLGEPHPPVVKRVARFRFPVASAGLTRGGHSHGHGLLKPYVHSGTQWIPWSEDRAPRPAAGWYLTPRGLEVWRQGGVPAVADFVHHSQLWTQEVRTGLGLEAGDRRSEDHMLYTFGYVRLRQGVSLGFEARGAKLRPGGRVRLGGEARTGLLEKGPPFPAQEPREAQGVRQRLAFVTPALAEAGGYPPGFSAGATEGKLAGRSCRLLGGVMGGLTLVGGWDLANQRAKPLRRAIPAGSVFVVEAIEAGSAADLDGICLSDFETERLAAQGFGLVVAGVDS